MNKKTGKILLMGLCLVFATGTCTACGGKGKNYSISDLSKYSEQVEEYVVSPNVANIMTAQEQSGVRTLSLTQSVVRASETTADETTSYNDTPKAYETLPDSLIELENAAKYLANKVKPNMNKVVNEMPEENMWVGFTVEEYIAEQAIGAGNATFSRVNTNVDGVLEYISVVYEVAKAKILGGKYIKLTDTGVENEPIVEYANISYYDHNDPAKNDVTGEFLYYVPNEQIYVWVADTDSESEYFCINENGNFTSSQNTGWASTIIDGNVENGFIEESFKNGEISYSYYKNNHCVMSDKSGALVLDLYNAKNVKVNYNETEIKYQQSDEKNEYYLEKTFESLTLPDGVIYEELNNDEKNRYQAVGRIKTDIDNSTDEMQITSGVSYNVTGEGFLKLSSSNEFNNRRENNNLADKLFSKEIFDGIYTIYKDYFNEDSTLSSKADEACEKLSTTECSFDFKNFKNTLSTAEIRYKYNKGSGSSLVENYPTNISSPNFDEYYVANCGVVGFNDNVNNPNYIYTCSFNGYEFGASKSLNVIFALSKDEKMIKLAEGNKAIKANNNFEDSQCTVDFDLDKIMETLSTADGIECGRYDLMAYFQDGTSKANKMDSLTEVVALIDGNQKKYSHYAVKKGEKYYNIKIHNTQSNDIDFDISFYLIIEEIKA